MFSNTNVANDYRILLLRGEIMTILEHLIEQLKVLKRADPRSMIECNIKGRKERFEITHLGNAIRVVYLINFEKVNEQNFKFKENLKAVAIKVLDFFKIPRDQDA